MAIRRENWIAAALEALRTGGTEAVTLDALARSLSVTKGSFYWHFSGRDELLEELLQCWEAETEALVSAAMNEPTALGRVLAFFEIVASHRGEIPDTEFFAWARRDPVVARRVDVVESVRMEFIRDQLIEAGLDHEVAEQRAEAGYLATVGWIECASRSHRAHSASDFRRFADQLFRWLFEGTHVWIP